MNFVGTGSDQKALYRDYLVDDARVDDLANEVVPPGGFVLDDRFRGSPGPRRSGDWLILASWTGHDLKRDGKRCGVSILSTKEVRIESNVLSDEEKRAVEQGGRTLVRVSSICDE